MKKDQPKTSKQALAEFKKHLKLRRQTAKQWVKQELKRANKENEYIKRIDHGIQQQAYIQVIDRALSEMVGVASFQKYKDDLVKILISKVYNHEDQGITVAGYYNNQELCYLASVIRDLESYKPVQD